MGGCRWLHWVRRVVAAADASCLEQLGIRRNERARSCLKSRTDDSGGLQDASAADDDSVMMRAHVRCRSLGLLIQPDCKSQSAYVHMQSANLTPIPPGGSLPEGPSPTMTQPIVRLGTRKERILIEREWAQWRFQFSFNILFLLLMHDYDIERRFHL